MPISVVESLRPDRLSIVPPWRGTRVFTVKGTDDRGEALTAEDADTGLTIPQRDAEHPYGSRLRCEGPEARRLSIDYWEITCNYSIPPTGSYDEVPTDPLLQKVVIDWKPMVASEPVDVDIDGRPMVYANGEPVQGLSRDVRYWRLSLTKNFPYFNPTLAETYGGATNSATVILTAGPTVLAHRMRVDYFGPAAAFTQGAAFVPISLVLDIVFSDALGDYPFQHRVMNQGTRGYDSDGEPSQLFQPGPSGHDPIGSPFKLQATGVPMALDGGNKLKVWKKSTTAYATPASAPNPWSAASSDAATDGTVWKFITGSNAVIGHFKKSRIVNLGPLLNLFN